MQPLIRLQAVLKTKIELLFKKNDRFSNKCSLRGKPGEEGKRTVQIDGKTDARSVNYSVQCVYDTSFNLGPEPKTSLPGRQSGPYCTHTESEEKKERERNAEGFLLLSTADGCVLICSFVIPLFRHCSEDVGSVYSAVLSF